AVDLVLSRLRAAPGEITLIQTGPLTNLAQGLLREPRIAEWAREIIIMGGAFTCSGNVTPRGEFNIHFDPEAARAVLHSGARIVLVGLDVTHQVLLRREHLEMLSAAGGEVPRFAAAISRGFLETHRSLGWEGAPLHDPLAVGVAAFPDLVGSQALAVDVETRGELTLGEMVADMRLSRPTQPNAHVCLTVEAQRCLEVFLQALKG
ncbi:MAG: nucleoside hydrolase, partial [Chloroflexi bacterium]|nr:nucleoside hydrolase [Chloroflexota bacterium]